MMTHKRILLGSALLLWAATANAAISNLQWPLGESQCLGVWSYSELKSCEVDDFSHPLYEGAVTYPSRNLTCGRWAFGHTVAETRTDQVWMNVRTGITTGDEAKNWCYSKQLVTEVASGAKSFWQNGQFMPENVQQKWVVSEFHIAGSDAFCTLELQNQNTKEDSSCGIEEDKSQPIRAFSGYAKKTAPDPACGATTRTLTQGSSIEEAINLSTTVKDSALCSTMDENGLLTAAEVKAKAVILNKELLAALRLDQAQCVHKRQVAEYTQLFVAQKDADIPASQKSLLSSISLLILNKCPQP